MMIGTHVGDLAEAESMISVVCEAAALLAADPTFVALHSNLQQVEKQQHALDELQTMPGLKPKDARRIASLLCRVENRANTLRDARNEMGKQAIGNALEFYEGATIVRPIKTGT